MRQAALDRLVAPLSGAQFRRRYWPDQTYFTHGRLARLRGLCDLPELATIESALKIQCRAVVAHGRSTDGEYLAFTALPKQAGTLYDAGLSVYLVDIASASPTLADWVQALYSELRLPARTLTPRLLASPKGAGLRMHFDPQEGLIIQLKGRKVWRVAPNRHIAYPPDGYVTGQEMLQAVAELAPKRLPQELPTDAETIEMRPGSVLFLPRGWWHETETAEDSLHLDLRIELPTWEQLAGAEISRLLRRLERWRAPAVRAWPEMRSQLLRDLAELPPSRPVRS